MPRILILLPLLLLVLPSACSSTGSRPPPEPAPARPAAPPAAPAAPAGPFDAGGATGSVARRAATEEELGARVRLHPDDPGAWMAWGLVAYERGHFRTAGERFDRAVRLDPDDRDARLNRGLARFAEKRYPEAVADFQAVLALPSDPKLLTDYALALEDYEARVARGEIDLPFPEAVRQGLLPVDRGMFARWYGRIASILAKGPGFEQEFTAESKHFRVVTDDSEGLARVTAGALELALEKYRELFPPPADAETPPPFHVTIFANRDDYVAWLTDLMNDRATAHLSGGSYHPLFRELILTKAADFDQTLLVLLHEGFHQYLDSFFRGAPPWLGEGLADYFGASELTAGGIVPGQRHPLRLDALRRALATARVDSLRPLMTATPEEFLGGRVADFRERSALVGRNYALSWALAHFLVEGEYRPVLARYYETVMRGVDVSQAFDLVFGPLDLDKFWGRFRKHAGALLAGETP